MTDFVVHEVVDTCFGGGGYVYARTDPPHPLNNPKGLYFLHRVLMENLLGRYLRDNEVVHHKDLDKRNNNLDNLLLLTRKEHSKIHRQHLTVLNVCQVCGKQFWSKKEEVFCSWVCKKRDAGWSSGSSRRS